MLPSDSNQSDILNNSIGGEHGMFVSKSPSMSRHNYKRNFPIAQELTPGK